jgi:hypothetical protein
MVLVEPKGSITHQILLLVLVYHINIFTKLGQAMRWLVISTKILYAFRAHELAHQ